MLTIVNATQGCYHIFDLCDIALNRVPKGLFEFVGRGAKGEGAGGAAGAASAIAIYREEIDCVPALLGCSSAAGLSRQYLHIAPGAFHSAAASPARIALRGAARS